jgi:predicted metalloenzyme YecM
MISLLTLDSLQKEGQLFMDYIFEVLGDNPLLQNSVCDHICFRANSTQDYLNYKKLLLAQAHFLSENIVNKRPISVFELIISSTNQKYKSNLLELTSPKENEKKKLGFEHLELVSPLDLRKIIETNPQLNFYTKNIDNFEPEIRLNYSKGSVKIRNKGLKQILKEEKQLD